MKELTLEIKPLEGLGELEFGMTPEEVFEYLGKPDEDETFEDDEMGDTQVYHFWERSVSAFFENTEEPGLSNLETDNPDVTLFGKHIFAMKEADIIKLMKDNGYEDIDTEMMEDEDLENEKRVSFDDAFIDFFFEDEVLTAVSWGTFFDIDEEDED
ncbi:MAG: hypothetical protein ACLFPE_00435 [Bacteroidales bacterium]